MNYVYTFLAGVVMGAAALGYLWYRYHAEVTQKFQNLKDAGNLIVG